MALGKINTDTQYKKWLSDLKLKVRQGQIKTVLSANSTMLNFYWELGRDIVEKQAAFKWGEGLFLQLSKDLAEDFPDIKGFSVSNLRYMRQWYLFYNQAVVIHQQAVGELGRQIIAQTQSLLQNLKSSLSTIEELEAGIALDGNEIGEMKMENRRK